jgi:hypothetical protein
MGNETSSSRLTTQTTSPTMSRATSLVDVHELSLVSSSRRFEGDKAPFGYTPDPSGTKMQICQLIEMQV